MLFERRSGHRPPVSYEGPATGLPHEWKAPVVRCKDFKISSRLPSSDALLSTKKYGFSFSSTTFLKKVVQHLVGIFFLTGHKDHHIGKGIEIPCHGMVLFASTLSKSGVSTRTRCEKRLFVESSATASSARLFRTMGEVASLPEP